VISAQSTPEVLTLPGFLQYAQAIGLSVVSFALSSFLAQRYPLFPATSNVWDYTSATLNQPTLEMGGAMSMKL
jgi:hypothetical protein